MICKKCKQTLLSGSLYCHLCGAKQITQKRKQIKRENGTGSIYKRADLSARPWVASTPETRNSKREIIGYYSTAQEAKDALSDYRRNPTTKLNITLKQLYTEWQPIGTSGKSKQLADSYRAAYNKLSDLFDIKFRELRTANIQSIIDDLQKPRPKLDKDGNQIIKDGKPQMLNPASYSSLHDIKVLLGLLYKYAMQNDIINKNYADFVILPPQNKGVKDCFSDIELKKIENAIDKIPFADCVLFMCYTGLRITEFLSLTKMSVKENNGITALYGGIKTEAGKNKIVPIHKKIKPILDKWMGKNGETIFCKEDGTPYTTNYFRNYCFYPALEKIEIRKLTPHATRRTFATMLSSANVREEDFIAMMGHSDFSVTVDSYIFQTAEKLQKAVESLP